MTMQAVRVRVWAVGAAAILSFAAMTGCADDNGNSGAPPANTSSTYQGGYSDDGNGVGGVNFTIAPTSLSADSKMLGGSSVEATGQVTPIGLSPVSLTGSYVPGSFTITLSSAAKGTSTYSLTGVLQGGAFHGTILTPSGSGGFAAVPVSAVTADTIYCGVYNCDTCEGGGGGYFDSIVFGSTIVAGVRSFADNTTIPLAGTRSANALSINDQGVVASGTISGSTVGGNYSIPDAPESGTWSGSTAACTGTRRR